MSATERILRIRGAQQPRRPWAPPADPSPSGTPRRRRREAATCRHGHEWNEANTYLDQHGKRFCRACRRERQLAAAHRRRAQPAAPATCCPNGHAYTPDNTYWRPDGRGRACRTCTRERIRRFEQRQAVGGKR